MNKHLNQCQLNEKFLAELFEKFPNSFNDWKITVIFYAATHLVRGYALSKGTNIGGSHTEVFNYLSKECGESSKVFKSFRGLYRNSRDARYNGFTGRENFELFCLIKLNESRTFYGSIKSYINSQGLIFETVISL